MKRYISIVASLISVLSFFCSLLPLLVNVIGLFNTPTIKKIHVFNEHITLQSGQSEEIEAAWYPNNADKDDLSCISDDPTIAAVDDLIVTAKECQEGNNSTNQRYL